MENLIVASIQMNSSSDLNNNLTKISIFIKNAKQAGAQLIVLPEYVFNIASDNKELIKQTSEELGDGIIQNYIGRLAKENNVYIVAGTISIKSEIKDKFYNSCLVFDNLGNLVTYYHKMHLFQYQDMQSYNENNIFLAGNKVSKFSINEFSFGIAICYDLRFPELFRAYVGVDGIILPAAFTYETGIAHWKVLLRARAIENQCYVISSAQTGRHGEFKRTYGHSMIINPWGELDSSIDEQEGIIISQLKKIEILNTRRKLPAIANIKFNECIKTN